uniref:(California timema) hypothetical protein n=1 Tax=Timema californicum TaxID=61474 RepID=A0A7R9JIE7_TIMCA|nr:unnamed protein product [Timema californicum]
MQQGEPKLFEALDETASSEENIRYTQSTIDYLNIQPLLREPSTTHSKMTIKDKSTSGVCIQVANCSSCDVKSKNGYMTKPKGDISATKVTMYHSSPVTRDIGINCDIMCYPPKLSDMVTLDGVEVSLSQCLREEYNDLREILGKIHVCTKEVIESVSNINPRKKNVEKPCKNEYENNMSSENNQSLRKSFGGSRDSDETISTIEGGDYGSDGPKKKNSLASTLLEDTKEIVQEQKPSRKSIIRSRKSNSKRVHANDQRSKTNCSCKMKTESRTNHPKRNSFQPINSSTLYKPIYSSMNFADKNIHMAQINEYQQFIFRNVPPKLKKPISTTTGVFKCVALNTVDSILATSGRGYFSSSPMIVPFPLASSSALPEEKDSNHVTTGFFFPIRSIGENQQQICSKCGAVKKITKSRSKLA